MFKPIALPVASALLLTLTACQSPTGGVVMPPRRRGTIAEAADLAPPAAPEAIPGNASGEPPPSAATTAVPDAAPEPPPPPPALPAGIALEVDGNPVSLADLKSGDIPTDKTVTVRADLDTRYEKVRTVLDTVHGLGYLIAVQDGE